QARGHLDQAEPHYLQAITQCEQLVREEPQKAEYRSALAHNHINLGSVYMQTHRGAQADRSYREAERLLKQLMREQPEEPDHPFSLAGVYVNWSYLLRDSDAAATGLQVLHEAVRLAEDVLQREPHYDYAPGRAFEAHGARATLLEDLK